MREQRKVVTILFCDVVGSTALGESTDPEALRARMRRYFADLRTIIERHGGTVEKFVGDAVMAVFGIPVAHEDDALRAVRAGFEMQTAISEHGLEARIGINTGEVVVGGEDETLVTGDAVNVAARLEQAAAAGEMLIGAETRALVRDAVRTQHVDLLELKGKSQPVRAYRLLDVVGDESVARHLETPLVGRERERRRLWRDYEDTVEDRACRLFTLLGPAGIGKSRLVADFLDRVSDSADVLRGRCLPYGEGITYWPLVEILTSIGVASETVVTSTPEETRVAFRRLLEARARVRPQVVVVDDLQWAEPVFVDLVDHVADLSRNAPIFVLCIARTELLDTRPGWGGGRLNATSLLLEPLDDTECAELIDLLLGETQLDDDTRKRITAASEGNALYVEEMVAMVRERPDENELLVPPTIHALLQARLDLLADAERLVVGHAAIEGEVFHRGALAVLVPPEAHDTLDDHLAALVRKELIRPVSGLLPAEDAYRFRHLLIRDAAYGALPKGLRARLHERLAGWLEESGAAPIFEIDEILGYHLEQAYTLRTELGREGDAERDLAARAGRKLVAAGRGALGRADYPGAVALLQRGADLLADDDLTGVAARIDLAEALVRRGELERAEELLSATIERARALGDQALEARARLAYNSLRTRTDPDARVEDELEEALEIAAWMAPTGDLRNLARVHIEIGMSRFMIGHAGEGAVDLRRAAELASQAGDTALEREASNARLRLVAWGPTPAAEGIAFCTMLLDNEATNASQRAHAWQVRALCEALRGEIDDARRSSSHAWALIEEFGLTLQGASYAMDVGYAELISGEIDRAERVLRQGHGLVVEVGDAGQQSTIDALIAAVLVLGGRYDEASTFATGVRAIAAADDLDAQPRWRAALARVLSARGEHAQALALMREAVALVEPIDLVVKSEVFDALGEVLARAGMVEEAATALERAIGFHEQKGNVVWAARSRSALNELRAAPRS